MNIAKMTVLPYGNKVPDPSSLTGPQKLPNDTSFQLEVRFFPFERLGQSWFGGDCYGGIRGSDQSLWLLIADVTGHGYYAYLIASVLPQVWEICWKKPSDPNVNPWRS